MLRHSIKWESSLRDEKVNHEHSTGLKRITLNRNPRMGDEGVKYIADALQDDLWFRGSFRTYFILSLSCFPISKKIYFSQLWICKIVA